MKENHEVITVSILVEWTAANGINAREIIPFRVDREEGQYRAVPMIPDQQRNEAGLPQIICFSLIDNCIVPDKSRNNGTLKVIRNLLNEMMMQELHY